MLKNFMMTGNPPTTKKCIRFPNPMIQQIEEEIKGTDCPFSRFVIDSVIAALESLEEQENQ